MSDKDKIHYAKNRLWHLIYKRNEVREEILDAIVQEAAEDIVYYVKRGD